MKKLKLAYIPTRRDVFSKEDAKKYSLLIKDIISKYDIEIVDLSGINEEELLFSQSDVRPTIEKMQGVDCAFFPHCNFGSEDLVSQVAKALGVPNLIWGPRDDSPDQLGHRNRDSQCGLFATGKVLRRHNVPFTYLTNSWYDSKEFTDGFERFLRVASVVKAVKGLRIMQISTRPAPFCSVICNENELIEKFGIQVCPITLTDLVSRMNLIMAKGDEEYKKSVEFVKSITANQPEEKINKVAALKCAMKQMCLELDCRAVAIQCWSSFEDMTGIMPCLANSMLTDELIPVVCETDIHGAITAVMTQALNFNTETQFFADITVRHPENDNAELLWHCGNFPYSLARDKKIAHSANNFYNNNNFGICEWELKPGNLTIARFDGDHGNYSLLIGEAKTTEGPKNVGSYIWVEVGSWKKWEHKLVEGPYIHHVSAVYGKYGEILAEACKYIPGLCPDIVENESEITERWY